MSNTDERTDKSNLDAAIDLVARQMLDVDPPPGLRRRVLDRLERRQPMLHWKWIAVSVAAAAVVVLAVIALRQTDRVAPSGAGDYRLPVATSHAEKPPEAHGPDTTAQKQLRPERRARAAVVDDSALTDYPGALPPLEGPSPIALRNISTGVATPLISIDVDPIEVPALEVDPLPETPRERP